MQSNAYIVQQNKYSTQCYLHTDFIDVTADLTNVLTDYIVCSFVDGWHQQSVTDSK